nr:leukemia NUP98 fusion partner 1 [Nothobranchius furzeri]XP_054590688.1 leukemia NUP98 fusion partner 1 [Nothobranchius furzeri]
MSLRLLPAIGMDNDEDDDGNFTKWMSSYWGHGADGGHSKERTRSFRRSSKQHIDRRASLPTVTQLDAMKLNRIHTATVAPRLEKGEARPHQRGHHLSSEENRPKTAIPENRIATIPELAESLERKLCLSKKRTGSQSNEDKLRLICHEDLCKSGVVEELPCSHRFHKEDRRPEQNLHRRSSDTAGTQVRRLSDERRRRSADGPISPPKGLFTFRRQLSLRRHR